MTKRLSAVLSSLLVLTPVAGASAQGQLAPDERQAPINSPYITGTGETVANPGRSQSGGTTPLDRGIQREDNKIDRSICKGC